MCKSHDIEQAVTSASRDCSAAMIYDESSVTEYGRSAPNAPHKSVFYGQMEKSWPKGDFLGLRVERAVCRGVSGARFFRNDAQDVVRKERAAMPFIERIVAPLLAADDELAKRGAAYYLIRGRKVVS